VAALLVLGRLTGLRNVAGRSIVSRYAKSVARKEDKKVVDKVLQRTMFETSRVLEYFTERELSYQTGHNKSDWPLVVLKELMDNALDACENASIPPQIKVELRHSGEQFL